MLLTEADTYDNLTIHFNTECETVDLDTNTVHFVNRNTKETFKVTADVIFGTDGAGSELRKSYFLQRKFLFSFSQNFLTHGYKELEIPYKELPQPYNTDNQIVEILENYKTNIT